VVHFFVLVAFGHLLLQRCDIALRFNYVGMIVGVFGLKRNQLCLQGGHLLFERFGICP